ncbi:MAG TPA: hypothetical protein VIL17_07480 [Coriobacteriia bacterium]
MTAYSIDLHNHMPVEPTDYRGPLDTNGHDVARAALDAGIDVLAVTDHFSLGFFRKVHDAAVGLPLLVLPGVEVRLSWGTDEAHLIAIFPPDAAEAGFSALMSALGPQAASPAGPLHRLVIEHDPVAAARTIERLGGMCHIAHVDRWFGDYRLSDSPLLRRIVDEASKVVLEFLDLASAEQLEWLGGGVRCIRSSDSHHCDEIGRRRSIVEADECSFEGIRRALVCSRATAL